MVVQLRKKKIKNQPCLNVSFPQMMKLHFLMSEVSFIVAPNPFYWRIEIAKFQLWKLFP